jgi:4-aminobutyrate aminotransferase-like enzyme/Ser/Thr protein kinase RdoA (MazF antagonist)
MELASAPRFKTADAERLARELYALEATATTLTSERDQNFLLTTKAGERSVLKIAAAGEDKALLDAQHQAMTLVAERTGLTQRVLPAKSGALIAESDGHLVRRVSYLKGTVAGDVPHHSREYRVDLGRSVARITTALAGFDHPAAHREFYWDLARGLDVSREHLPLVRDTKLKRLVRGLLNAFEHDVAPTLPKLPKSVIHNDANDHNVIVRDDGDIHERRQRVAGIIDFGDMVHSWTVGDLAIGATYAALDATDPLAAIADVARGYHGERALKDAELAVLFDLVRLRLCTSVCVAAHQTKQRPGDAYLSVSQAAIARTLPRLASIHPRLAEATFRVAAGLEGSPQAARVTAYLKRHAAKFKPILGRKLDAATTMPMALDVGSAIVSGNASDNVEPTITERIFTAMKATGAKIAFGGYGEARLLYSSPLFDDPLAAPGERRTVHLGIDLFGAVATPVHAPLSGRVVKATYNPKALDYGGLIILEHSLSSRVQSGPGSVFYTIYGHLSRASLKGLKPGARVKAGQRIGAFGNPSENGGWTPHLHFQIATDLLDFGTDFPGVALPSRADALLALCPDPTPMLGLPSKPKSPPRKADTLAERKRRLGGNVSVAYRDPVKIVRGHMQYLHDDTGRRYIDAYNNVPHVGHSHPRVVAAAASQMSVLSTNTRYLHDAVNQFAAELCETLPKSLSVCWFVNSGSEANELALRLVRAYTGERDVIVLEAAYHGITTSLIDISPYKHLGPGGDGAPNWVHSVPIPDDYRGKFKRHDPKAGEKYAAMVAERIAHIAKLQAPSACSFIAESLPSVGGQIVFPPGYLANVYKHVRAAGGVCIADEVQTGYGRIGTHFWGFEQQGVVPDIVVLGKPIGNGYPIGAVVTTAAIAERFNNGMEFFSTFGGSTVSAVVGREVLRVTREERLQQHARIVGSRMLTALRKLMQRHAIIGDVRGSGLFIGVELVRDRVTLDPAGDEASYVVNRMREEGILLGTDGPHHNVLKIRPPMPFSNQDADTLVATLDRLLSELSA